MAPGNSWGPFSYAKGQVMKRYKISVFGGGRRSDVVMDLRPTELKTVERVARLFLEDYEGFDGEPWIDVEEVESSTLND